MAAINNINEKKEMDDAHFELIREKFLSIQKKYETKINELSILKEMAESMKSIDLTDQDKIWRNQLDCLIKYKTCLVHCSIFSKISNIMN